MKRLVLAAVVLLVAAPVTLGVGAGSAGAAPDDSTAEVVARYPSDGEMVEETVLAPPDVERVVAPRKTQTGGWEVRLTLTAEGASSFTDTLVDAGFTTDGVGACEATGERNNEGYCLLNVVDGEVVSAYSLGAQLAEAIESGSFEESPQFVFATQNLSAAERAAEAFGWTQSGTTRTTMSVETTQTTQESVTTQTSQATATTDAPSELGDGSASDADVPGFGVVAALLAVAAGAVARRRV